MGIGDDAFDNSGGPQLVFEADHPHCSCQES